MIACFGIPEQIQADPVFCENGMDIAGSVQGRYEGKRCKGAEAEILYSQVSASHVPSQIRGEKGSLVIRSIADPSELCFYGRDGEKEVLALRTSPVITDEEIRTWIARACLGIHSRHRYVPLRGISGPNPGQRSPLRLPHRDRIPHKVERTAYGKQFSDAPWSKVRGLLWGMAPKRAHDP